MLNKLLTKDFIRTSVKCKDWKDAICKGVKLLEDKNLVKECYKDAIFRCFDEFGPYMVIAPGIVLSHARPEDGVIEKGMSLITLDTPIEFGSELNDPVTLIFTLAAKDSNAHLEALKELMEILINEDDLKSLFNAKNTNDILKILNK
ncbi:PTS system IIA component, L-Asc family (TC 4.A.7) [Clostridium cavendishii DSM 21758]|uniref:Ascorbate-specific PTS system EIIA component n=1 Tax=Clostridium cavendishii DSM 21758 TaxID=1121302 RepID=A0A1M6TE66_9CLOT|nr:PTS sugar transporter subunit IIA [Clostridium cavendishii]SHK55260.1 PTS system IIA component, L-Asc family (TC 4.A.7) [Clostridium cavendishii DSM 21758]